MLILVGVLLAAALVYPAMPLRLRPAFLAIVSIATLAGFDVYASLAYLALGLLIYYAPGLRCTSLSRIGLQAGVSGLATFLVVSKHIPEALMHYGVVAESTAFWIAPLGVSYFTFKAIHYVIERKRGTLPEHDLPLFLCYLFFFPVLSAGPIQRFESFRSGFADRVQVDDYSVGLTRITYGLFKRFILIDLYLRPLFFSAARNPEALLAGDGALSSLLLWVYLGGSFLLLYLDFSAYSDLAIGTARLFGIRVVENFNWPILAVNIRDFWQRWHMTLSSWCQVYVYLPVLARTRNPYFSVYASFLVMGLWHGLSWGWVCWGLFHASGIAANTWVNRRFMWIRTTQGLFMKMIGWGLTMGFVALSGVFTMTENHLSLAALPQVLAKLLFLY